METREVITTPQTVANIAENIKNVLALHDTVKIRQLPDIAMPVALEIDVLDNGHCMFYSITLGFLFPVVNDENEFNRRFELLFGYEPQIETPGNLRDLLQKYNGDRDFIKKNEFALESLASVPLRASIVDYMKRTKFDLTLILEDELIQAQLDAKKDANASQSARVLFFQINGEELPEEPAIEAKEVQTIEERAENYYKKMLETSAWGGPAELLNASRMLKTKIIIFKETEEGNLVQLPPINDDDFKTKIYLVHTGGNHYHYLVDPDSFCPGIVDMVGHSSSPSSKNTNNSGTPVLEVQKEPDPIPTTKQILAADITIEQKKPPKQPNPNRDAYIAQYRYQIGLAIGLTALVVLATFVLTPFSLFLTIRMAKSFYKEREKVKKLIMTDKEKTIIKAERINVKTTVEGKPRKIPISKETYLVDTAQYERFFKRRKDYNTASDMRRAMQELKEESKKIRDEIVPTYRKS